MDTAVVAVQESCVLDVKSGTPLIISSGRVLVKNKVSVLQLKVSLSFLIVPMIVSRKHVIHVPPYFSHSWKKWDRRKSLLL